MEVTEQASGLQWMETQGMAQDVVTGGGVQKISGHCGAVGQQGTLGAERLADMPCVAS